MMRFNFVLAFVLLALLFKSEADDYDGCRGYTANIQVTGKGDIFSPEYNKGIKYPLLTTCSYLLETDPDKRIRLKFVDFELERTEGCAGDWFMAQDETTLKIFCGDELPRDYLSSGDSLHISFNSDFMVAKRGYHVTYEPTTDKTLCPGQFACRNRKCVSSSLTCNGNDDCEDGSDEEACRHSLDTPSKCGQPTIQPAKDDDERIVGGYEVIPGSWPWQSELQIDAIEPSGHVCGGSLINNQWVVSAAHCFEENALPHLWRIHLGKHHKFQRDDSEQVRYVERIVFHPEITEEEAKHFEHDTDHDIALLKLNAPVKFTDEVQTICLPTKATVIPPGTECYATGWGETRGSGKNDVLKQTKLIVEKDAACRKPILEIFGTYNQSLKICAGIKEGQHGPCHGDSGGPLACKLNNRWILAGLSSAISDVNYIGGLCAARDVPATFTKVSHWADWIDEMMKKYNNCSFRTTSSKFLMAISFLAALFDVVFL